MAPLHKTQILRNLIILSTYSALQCLLEKNFEYLTLTFLIQLCFGNKTELTLIRNSPLST